MSVISKEEFDRIDKSTLRREKKDTPAAIIYQYENADGAVVLLEVDPKDGSPSIFQRC
tara:strand:+ start:6420 stop:6593 length:174 start_codon:yes stop_codon:yes gene_type:complete